MPKEKKIPTSEAALKRAIQSLRLGENTHFEFEYIYRDEEGDEVLDVRLFLSRGVGFDDPDKETLWEGKLSDLIKKRKPLTGVTKKLKKAIR